MTLIPNRFASLAIAASAALLFAIPGASAHSWGERTIVSLPGRTIEHVDADRSHWRRTHFYSTYRGDVIVDAPAAYVVTAGRRTWVDAPFTAVRVYRHRGVWVRAPFVNIYVRR